ncbi:type I secretion protein [Neisseria sp.]|uniref:type I secretion protein n=1 Tax=Neisseria sp. TaxID=192066 RepID=UPI0035A0C6D9
MVNQVLNPQSEKELAAVGFAKAELDRIKANDLLVQQVNEFAARGGNFGKTDQGAFYHPGKGDIFFQRNAGYTTYRVLAHELGHALGREQAKAPSAYPTAKEYTEARSRGEAEAIYNEFRIIEHERKQHGKAVDTVITGNLYAHIAGKSEADAKKLLGLYNKYAMQPSTGKGETYYEQDMIVYLVSRSSFSRDYREAGLPEAEMDKFLKHMINYDTLGNKRGNSVNAEHAVSRDSLLPGHKQTRLNSGAHMYGDDGHDLLKGTKHNDKIIGGRGNDILQGNEGRDLLAGGRGYDTYRADKGDTIRDFDGKGEVHLNGTKLTGGIRSGGSNPLEFTDGKWHNYRLDPRTNTLTVNDGLRIENFQNGHLGINLRNSTQTASLENLNPKARKLYDEIEAHLAKHQDGDKIRFSAGSDNVVAALAAAAYERNMPEVQRFGIKGDMVGIMYKSERTGAMQLYETRIEELAAIPQRESFGKIQDTEQARQIEEQQRLIEQQQSRGISR